LLHKVPEPVLNGPAILRFSQTTYASSHPIRGVLTRNIEPQLLSNYNAAWPGVHTWTTAINLSDQQVIRSCTAELTAETATTFRFHTPCASCPTTVCGAPYCDFEAMPVAGILPGDGVVNRNGMKPPCLTNRRPTAVGTKRFHRLSSILSTRAVNRTLPNAHFSAARQFRQ